MPGKSRLAGAVVLALAVGCAALGSRPLNGPAGEPAPFTEGVDASGRPLRLDDQRGRVVLLNFWHSA